MDVCPEYCLKIIPLEELEMEASTKETILKEMNLSEKEPLSVMIKDDEKCIRCGLCAKICPTEAMTMERFSFDEAL